MNESISYIQGVPKVPLNFFIGEIRKLHKVRSIIFQQDGAPPHFARDVRQYLDSQFPQRWIGRGGPIRWALRSPDLTPLDFFLWDHLKNIIYQTPIKNLNELKMRIQNEVKSISKDTLCNVFENISKRMELCIEMEGNHFENLLKQISYEIKLERMYYHSIKKNN